MKQMTQVLSTVDMRVLINRVIYKMPILTHLDVEFPALSNTKPEIFNFHLRFKLI